MLSSVDVSEKSLDAYRQATLASVVDAIRQDAAALTGARVLHVDATAYGDGVAEILASLVPLMRDLGLGADWKVISRTDQFFGVTKAMHNALQGKPYDWTPAKRALWIEPNKANADGWKDYDFVVIHWKDPCDPMGTAGRELVREHFLLTRYLHDYVRMFRTIAGLPTTRRG